MNRPRPVAISVMRCVRSMRNGSRLFRMVPVWSASGMIRYRRPHRSPPMQTIASTVRTLAPAALLACAVAAGSGAAQAQSFAVATWNVGWLDERRHACAVGGRVRPQWVARPDRRPPRERARRARRAALLRRSQRHAVSAGAMPHRRATGGRRPRVIRPTIHAATRRTSRRGRATRKSSRLCAACSAASTNRACALVALEEVFDADAVRQLLPPRWSVATTRELPGTPSIAQHVGVAWRRGIAVSDIEAINTLADSGVPERPLRPGLAFTVVVAGQPVRALIVHLKAGCRSRDLDAPLTSKDATLPDERQDAISSDCAMLRYQLPALEDWIDANAGADFAVLGDFNRTLLREPPADSRTYRTRLDGSAAGDPLGRCTMARSGNRWVAQCPDAHARHVSRAQRRAPAGRGPVARAVCGPRTAAARYARGRPATAAFPAPTAI